MKAAGNNPDEDFSFVPYATATDRITSQIHVAPVGWLRIALTISIERRGLNPMASNLMEKQASIEDVLREVSRFKSVVTEAVEEGVQSAVKALKQGRSAAEDVIYDAQHTVKQKPLQAVGVVFAAGVLAGSLLGWLSTRRS
jgi:ElaB/YqjD/DUF883 family membrane-anchored ribosome-binding protein